VCGQFLEYGYERTDPEWQMKEAVVEFTFSGPFLHNFVPTSFPSAEHLGRRACSLQRAQLIIKLSAQASWTPRTPPVPLAQ